MEVVILPLFSGAFEASVLDVLVDVAAPLPSSPLLHAASKLIDAKATATVDTTRNLFFIRLTSSGIDDLMFIS
ncbi:hypothetical protein D3C85_1730940 [compost metagenome]